MAESAKDFILRMARMAPPVFAGGTPDEATAHLHECRRFVSLFRREVQAYVPRAVPPVDAEPTRHE